MVRKDCYVFSRLGITSALTSVPPTLHCSTHACYFRSVSVSSRVQVVEECVYVQARQGLDEYLKKALKRTDVVGLETKCTALREKDQTFFNIPPSVQSPDGWCDASIWVVLLGVGAVAFA